MMKALAVPILALAGLSACASVVPPAPAPMAVSRAPGAELIGQQVRLETAAGQVSTLHFAPNGVVHAQFGGQQVAGNWVANQTQLCFSWAGAARECWPYTAPLRRGQTVSLTSDRGNVLRVTLL
jgi:hypothetical protein